MKWTPGEQYLCERFLAAFDETQARYSLSNREMEELFDRPGRAKLMPAARRRFLARRMHAVDADGKKVKTSAIADILGISKSSVEQMVTNAETGMNVYRRAAS